MTLDSTDTLRRLYVCGKFYRSVNAVSIRSSCMEVKFRPTPQDLIDRSRAVKSSSLYTWLFFLSLSLLFLVGIFLIDHGFEIAGWLWLVVSSAVGVGLYWRPTLCAKRALKNNPLLQGEITVRFDERGVQSEYTNGRSSLDWRAFTGYKENPKSFLLFASEYHCNLIPKAALSASQIEELRSILRNHISV